MNIYLCQESYNKVSDFLIQMFKKYADARAVEEILYGQDQ